MLQIVLQLFFQVFGCFVNLIGFTHFMAFMLPEYYTGRADLLEISFADQLQRLQMQQADIKYCFLLYLLLYFGLAKCALP